MAIQRKWPKTCEPNLLSHGSWSVTHGGRGGADDPRPRRALRRLLLSSVLLLFGALLPGRAEAQTPEDCTAAKVGDLRVVEASGAETIDYTTIMYAAGAVELCSAEQQDVSSGGMSMVIRTYEWRSVCDDFWDNLSAQVACRQLGYTGGEGVAVTGFAFADDEPVAYWLDDVMCTGTENSLPECSHNGLGAHNCKRDERAGVRCTPAPEDTIPPMLVFAEVNGATLSLTYDEILDPNSQPATTAFTVTVGGTNRSVTAVMIERGTVHLTLASPVQPGETVQVSYTPPATNPLQDPAQTPNPAPAFSNQSVTNNTLTLPAAPTNLQAPLGPDGQVTLTWEKSARPLLRYDYRQSTDGGDNWSPDWTAIPNSRTGQANEASYAVPSLTNGTPYTFELRAVNGLGPGPEARVSVTPLALPTLTLKEDELDVRYTGIGNLMAPNAVAPTAFTVKVARADIDATGAKVSEPKIVTLAVTSAIVGGARVTLTLAAPVWARETVTLSYTPPATKPVRTSDGTAVPAFFDVAVTNDTDRTMPTPLTTDTAFTVRGGNGQVTLRWEQGTAGGAPIIRYEYRQSADGGDTWSPDWTAIPDSGTGQANEARYTVSSLTNGTRYTFELRAVNSCLHPAPEGTETCGAGGAYPAASATPAVPRQPSGGGGGVGGGGGGGGAEEEDGTAELMGLLENPGPASFQSGVGVISGWTCDADQVVIEINGETQPAAYGTERADTADICGDTDNGFGLLFNWNRLGDGEHTVVALVDGVELGRAVVTVTTLGAEFVRGAEGECVVDDFPSPGETGTLVWQQNSQNFVIVDGSTPSGVNRAGTPGVGYLENPGPNAFQSGIGVLSGWVCEAEAVEIAIGHLGRQVAGYGTERLDTEAACGDTDNGFGLLFNWNRLGDGEHEVVAYVDEEELGRATVRVTTLGAEFVRDVEGACVVEDFPLDGQTVLLEWQQTSQNFVMTEVD